MRDAVEISLRVRYAETDQMGIAYYANHLVWFELGRAEWFRQHGFTYREMEEKDGAFFPVAEAHCTYHAPARYDDLLTVRTRIKQARSRSFAFSYEILRPADGQLIATGETIHVITDHNGRPRSLPNRYRAILLARTPH